MNKTLDFQKRIEKQNTLLTIIEDAFNYIEFLAVDYKCDWFVSWGFNSGLKVEIKSAIENIKFNSLLLERMDATGLKFSDTKQIDGNNIYIFKTSL